VSPTIFTLSSLKSQYLYFDLLIDNWFLFCYGFQDDGADEIKEAAPKGADEQ
jgi:hypothetical protein